MRPITWAVWGACLCVSAALAVATVLRPLESSPTLQQRVMSIAADVRCPECQGESAAESNAAASLAIRSQIARDLGAGEGRAQILRQLATEYGDWILYRPPARGAFLLLWATPLLALAAVGGVLGRMAVRWRAGAAPSRGAAPDGVGDAVAPEPSPDLNRRLARYL